MSLVENLYNDKLDRMTGRERVERTAALFSSMCEMLALQIDRESPNLPRKEKKIKLAEILYLSDPMTQMLIKRSLPV